MNNEKIFSRDFILSTSINFFLMLNYYTPIVIMTDYATQKLHASVGGGGLATGIFVIGALVARIFAGKWIQTTGRRNMLVYSSLITLAMNLMYFAAGNLATLTLVRFLHGIAYGAAATAVGTIAAGIIPASRRGEGLGYYLLSVTVASAIGPFIGMNMIKTQNFNLIFAVCCVMALFTFAQALIIRPQEQAAEKVIKIKAGIHDYIEFAAIPVSLVCMLIYFCYSGVVAFLSPFSKAEGLTTASSFYFIVYSAVILMSRPYTGKLFDSKGENITMYPSFIIFALGFGFIAFAHGTISILLSAACLGLGLGAIQSGGLAIAVRLTSKNRLGLANSTFYMFVDAGVGIGPLVLGSFVENTGYRGMYMALGVVSLACILIYYFLHGRHRTQENFEHQPVVS